MSELRWNPLLGEWVATATHRQDRTFLPPKDFCPLCPTKPGQFETEVPEADYDVVVFQNRFPSLRPDPAPPAVEPTDLYPVANGEGVCEVVLYTPEHNQSLATVDVLKIEKLIHVWADRYRELGKLDFVKHVFIFENKGEEIGVTLTHPHGQIYAYPFVPPVIEKELRTSREYHEKHDACLLCAIGEEERRIATRVVYENATFIAYIPFFARWPYEVHILPKRHLLAIDELTQQEKEDLAVVIKDVLSAYDNLFGRPMPYIMAMHQKPSDGGDYSFYHFHIEFYPPLRTASKLKYLAGSETGAGMFINDTLAEEKAAELRKATRSQAA